MLQLLKRSQTRVPTALLSRWGVRNAKYANRLQSTRPIRPLLDGYTVLELASVLAGPSVCQYLAELGADVIKVENTTTNGDVTRTWRLPADDNTSDITAYFSAINLGKRSVALDLKDARGLDAVHRLAKVADVVVASYKPGDAERLGVDFNTLSALNPEMIYAQITGYGLDDPRPGYDAVIQAESGFQFMNGSPDGEPTKLPVALIDVLTAHHLKAAVLEALWRREREQEAGGRRRGAFVDVSLLASGVTSLVNQATGYLRLGELPRRMGSDHPSIVPYGTVFECRDGLLVTLAVGSDKQFVALCDVLGAPTLAADERFSTNPSRVRHRDECKAAVRLLIKDMNRAELLAKLRAAAVPAGGVYDLAAVFEQPQAEALVVRGVTGEPIGLRQVAYHVQIDGERLRPNETLRPPPAYGEHSVEVLAKSAGLADEQIVELLEAGVTVQTPQAHPESGV